MVGQYPFCHLEIGGMYGSLFSLSLNGLFINALQSVNESAYHERQFPTVGVVYGGCHNRLDYTVVMVSDQSAHSSQVASTALTRFSALSARLDSAARMV